MAKAAEPAAKVAEPRVSVEATRDRAVALRVRAALYERVSWLFLAAMLVALLGGGLLFYYLPLALADQDRSIIETETRKARIAAIRSGQEGLKKIVLGPMRDQAVAATLPYLVKAGKVANDARQLHNVHFDGDGLRGWAVGYGGTIRVTVDGGESWTGQTSGSSLFQVESRSNF